MTDRPVFYYDLGSPYAYLAAERVNQVLPVVPVWQPILLGGIWQHTGGDSWARTEKRDEGMREIERRAELRGLQPIRWPDPWPGNTLSAMRAATFAKQTGRAVALLPGRLPPGLRRRPGPVGHRQRADRRRRLRAASERGAQGHRDQEREGAAAGRDRRKAFERGVRGVPTVAVGDEVFWGDDRLEDAAEALAARGF